MNNTTMTLNSQEQERSKVLDQHLAGKLSVAQVAARLKCSERHVYRLKAAYREKGEDALKHGNRGKRSPVQRYTNPPEHIAATYIEGF